MVSEAWAARLAELPHAPGCYIFRDATGTEIYVGKAKDLRKRVASYFRRGRGQVPRTERLVLEATSVEIIETDSEVEALLLENQLIKELQPRFNVKLRDDKTYPLLAISREEFPKVFLTRRSDLPAVDYFGPFASMTELRKAYNFLMRVFQFRICDLEISEADPKRRFFKPCLNYHIKRCSAPCTQRITAADYGADIKALKEFLRGRAKQAVIRGLQQRMQAAAQTQRYEDAARYRDQLQALARLAERGSLDDIDIAVAPTVNHQQALTALQKALGLDEPPRVIEGFDIAHLQGSDVVASMVQFVNGLPNKDGYRRYKIARDSGVEKNDDFAAMHEVVGRRYRRLLAEGLPLPSLILIDGGLGQVHAAQAALTEAGIEVPALYGLAKQQETLIHPDGGEIHLLRRNPGLKLLMYVRDEAHRFSRRYHHLLRRKGTFNSGDPSTD